ncbi:MAG TPA: LD-carboxypeptidase [Candidatus Limnocylindria bacterium]|nr:LD-carboxypeptidase [Candidatus Limnocylindria bacterium]
MAPSGAVDAGRLARGVAVLESWGLRVRLGRAIGERCGYLAGPDERRLADLQAMLDDPDVRAVFCARGGYGSQRIVPSVDWSGLVRSPKLIIGYSDATVLLAAALRAIGTAVHGPMVADDLARGLAAPAVERLRRLLMEPDYRWHDDVPVCVRPGCAEGRLVGGCLSVVAATLGTPHALDARGAILFLEDVNEHAYRLDRLLLQIRQSGLLDGVAGVVFGTFETCAAHDGVTPLDVVRDHFADARVPVAYGLAAGHSPAPSEVVNMALPLGIRVRLDATGGRLAALEAAVA